MRKLILIFGIAFINNIQAADLTIPNTFTAGTPAVAAEVNANFTAVEGAVDDNNTNITTNAAGISSNSGDISTNAADIFTNATVVITNTSGITANDARIAALEAAPKANVAVTAPTAFDDIKAGIPEGSVRVDTTSKQAFILVDSTANAAVWHQVTNTVIYYKIGDTGPAGGIVFHVTDGGLHGLESAPTDTVPATAPWGCLGVTTGATGLVIGTGASNTADIVAALCQQVNDAAALADAYTLNGFDDWFLPSKDELNELYLNRVAVGGFANSLYWSSSEVIGNFAWAHNFIIGVQTNFSKDFPHGVRAVRAF